MLKYLTILSVCSLAGCAQSGHQPEKQPEAVISTSQFILPDGFSVIEQQPQGYFIRLASPERASVGTIQIIAASVDGAFDRIDFCLDTAHERGDEYASVIDGKLFDYENDIIKPLK